MAGATAVLARALRRRRACSAARARRGHARLARADDAQPPARRGPRRARPACARSCSAAGRSRRDLLDWAEPAGMPVTPVYGMTETASQVVAGIPGRPLPGVELRIAADGEILVRGPMVARATGWLHTGDTRPHRRRRPAARRGPAQGADRHRRRERRAGRGRGGAARAPRGRRRRRRRPARPGVGRGGHRVRRAARARRAAGADRLDARERLAPLQGPEARSSVVDAAAAQRRGQAAAQTAC